MSLDYASVTASFDAHADIMRSRLEPPPAEEMPLTVYDDAPMAGKAVRRGTEPTRKPERLRGTSQSADWPEPRPIAHELRPVPPFQPETLLPEVLRAWVMDEAERKTPGSRLWPSSPAANGLPRIVTTRDSRGSRGDPRSDSPRRWRQTRTQSPHRTALATPDWRGGGPSEFRRGKWPGGGRRHHAGVASRPHYP